MPSIGKYVSASNSSRPVSGRLSPRPGRWDQRASRAFMTNQPALSGTRPAPLSFSFASGTIRPSLSATELLQSSPRRLVEPVRERRPLLLDVVGRLELGEERLGRHGLDHPSRS